MNPTAASPARRTLGFDDDRRANVQGRPRRTGRSLRGDDGAGTGGRRRRRPVRATRDRQRERSAHQPGLGGEGSRRGQVHDAWRRATPGGPQRPGTRHPRGADRRHPLGCAAEHLHQHGEPVHRLRQRTAAGRRRQARAEGQLRRHRLLRPSGAGGVAAIRRRLVVDHHHRRAAPDRGVHQRLRLRLLLPGGAAGLTDQRASRSSPPGNASAWSRAPCRRPTSSTPWAWTRSSSPTTTPSTPA